jgi:hypothetical protein
MASEAIEPPESSSNQDASGSKDSKAKDKEENASTTCRACSLTINHLSYAAEN